MSKILVETRIHIQTESGFHIGPEAEVRIFSGNYNVINQHDQFPEILQSRWESAQKTAMHRRHCMNLRSGKEINILDPDPGFFDVEDISAGLAYKPHFSGQTPFFFSVAQHSLLVAQLIHRSNPTNYAKCMGALLHDAEEAFLGDMIAPVKKLFPLYEAIAKKFKQAIMVWSGCDYSNPAWVAPIKKADIEVQNLEKELFYGSSRKRTRSNSKIFEDTLWKPMAPETAKTVFESTFNFYKKQLSNE